MSNTIQFSKEELERYSRHLIIPEFNIEGQRKLKQAKVLVVGAGGLGSPLLLYLTAAGVGTIGIVDFDLVDDSNLQRQVLYGTESVGLAKVEAARQRLLALNPHIQINIHNTYLSSEKALDIIRDYDLVADGTDNFPTRYLVNDACVILGIPNVYASIYRFDGQVSVFNYKYKDGTYGPNYRDLFPTPPPPGLVPSCAEGGVLGVLPGIIGSLQASEVIKVVTGIGEPLAGRLFLFDALDFSTRTLKIRKNPNSKPIEKLVDYQALCGLKIKTQPSAVPELSVEEFAEIQNLELAHQLIDVREPYEQKIVSIGGVLIPQATVEEHLNQISRDKKVIIHCRSGKRSGDVVRLLKEKYGFDNVYNLKGGILEYAKKINQRLAVY